MPDLLFYQKPVALNKEVHKGLKVAPNMNNFGFASNTNSVILAGVEFAEAAKEYPIVFASTIDSKIVPVALLGMRNNENLFIAEDGRWDANYVPAFVRRYPFVLAETDGTDEMTVCIDEGYPGFSLDNGEPLFKKDGSNTALLDNAVKFLGEYHQQYKLTAEFVAFLQECDLFQTLNAQVDLPDGRQFALNNFMVIDEKKLRGIKGAKLKKLFADGTLPWVYAHLMSLSNMNRMLSRIPPEETA